MYLYHKAGHLDNSQGNFTTWRDALYEQVTQLKYGEIAPGVVEDDWHPSLQKIVETPETYGCTIQKEISNRL